MKLYFILSLLLATNTALAQTSTGKVKWVSPSHGNYIYTGEMVNGKPDGTGLAISAGRGDSIIFGQFKNGKLEGRSMLRNSSGSLIVALFKENKMHGMAVIITSLKHFSYLPYVDGVMDGKAIVVQNNNTINIGQTLAASYHGRVLEVPSDGKSLYDNIYTNNAKSGQGYQYDTEKKQMFEGIWENGAWVRASTGNYPSFMRNKKLGSQVTNDHVWIYSELVGTGTQTTTNDTCFNYDIINNNRWFGYFNRGKFTNGIRLLGDSTRTIGEFNENNQKHGFCVEYKLDKYLIMGNFKNGTMDGPGIDIDIDDSTIYDGYLTENSFTGRAVRLMKNKEIRIGEFEKGMLVGNGKTIFPDGRSVSGTYDKGRLTNVFEFTNPDGKKIDMNPKDISTAINFLLKEWENNFSTINSGVLSGTILDRNQSWYSVLGGSGIIITGITGRDGKPHNEFSAEIKKSSDYILIKNEYDALCKKLTASAITSLQKGKVIKLVPKLKQQKIDPENNRMATLFDIPAYNGKKNTAMIRVMVEEKYDKSYLLTLDIITK